MSKQIIQDDKRFQKLTRKLAEKNRDQQRVNNRRAKKMIQEYLTSKR